jgi:hypothetical protein
MRKVEDGTVLGLGFFFPEEVAAAAVAAPAPTAPTIWQIGHCIRRHPNPNHLEVRDEQQISPAILDLEI